MSITAKIFYRDLRRHLDNRASVEVAGHNVGECLADLEKRFPGAAKFIFDRRGRFLKHVFVYVNAESLSKAALAAPVKDGDELIIAVLVSGG